MKNAMAVYAFNFSTSAECYRCLHLSQYAGCSPSCRTSTSRSVNGNSSLVMFYVAVDVSSTISRVTATSRKRQSCGGNIHRDTVIPFNVSLLFVPGRVAQSVGHLTRKSEALGSIPGLATYFRFSFR